MPITGKFEADFSQFHPAVQGAVADLMEFEKGGDKVKAVLAGIDAPIATTTGGFSRLHGSLAQFDAALSAAGVHIGPEVRGIAELGEAAGKTSGQLGLIATAGFVVAAALAGWKIGRAISEFFDLDNAIGNATAKLLGWGDLVSQVSGAQQDVMTRAIERGAAATITYGEALAFNNTWLKEHNEHVAKGVKAGEDWAKAMVELNAAGDGWKGTLETIDGETVTAVQYYLEAGVAQDKLATAYDLTAVQVKAVASALTAEQEVTKAAEAELHRLGEEFAKTSTAVGNLQDLVAGAQGITPALARAATEFLRLGASQSDIATAFNLSAGAVKALADELTKVTAAQLVRLNAVNAAVIAEFEAQTKLNAAQGRDAAGAFLVQTSAAETLRIGLERLHAAAQVGISQTAQETVLYDDFARSIGGVTAAENDAYLAQLKVNASLERGAAIAQGTAQSFAGLTVSIAATTDQMAAFYAATSLLNSVGTQGANNIGVPSGLGAGNFAANDRAALDTLERLGLSARPRAGGGPVSSGSAYVVGERGPELFTPGASGFITPNGGGQTIQIYITQPLGTPAAIAAAVDQALMARQRNTGQRLPVS